MGLPRRVVSPLFLTAHVRGLKISLSGFSRLASDGKMLASMVIAQEKSN